MIKFLDLHKINNRYRDAFEASFKSSLDDAYFVLGKNVTHFENEFAKYCGTTYCVGTANGLDALTLILKGYIQLGILKKGDKVLVPANTFIATILSVLHADLVPVLVEPDPETYNISVASVKANITDAKAIIMVHLYGQLCNVESLQKIAETHNLLLIEDAAQAHGAECKLGKAGSLSHAAAFSFYPSKNLGALGDGGAITTSNPQLVDVVKLLRNYGSAKKYVNEIVGVNSRLDDMQAAFLNIKLKTLDADNDKRRKIASAYVSGIKNPKIKLPFYDTTKAHVFYAFVVEVENRTEFTQFLDAHKIEWLIHYPTPAHKQQALSSFSNVELPITEQIHKKIISLPISPVMSTEEVQQVIAILNSY
ncbi:DegT/DnrJ/EryC1/StrS family aminotransferase [Winogradskyella eckloniae]|uniref:DegT/DnrJ/EryC1/StrS family aminotransferase n=1 Tax=Winogradskyella eckloniae TaxID=1089306 RepID=UPI001566EF0A|nr:DegT/DnrJ/EryC1/StrS family aminotransferase [Winogradskyella eckloniae]NRD20745.1 DegT/DnrJ/EryC1/StrS family aminotransferase [Winogradskyella eckloniae]